MEDPCEDVIEDIDGLVPDPDGFLADPEIRKLNFKDHFWHDVERVRGLLRSPEPCDPSELAGFFDGDGCFYNAQVQVGCNITQCYYPALRLIQECFGGTMWKRDTKHRSEKQRFQYALSFRNIEVTAIIPIIKDHLVLKGARAGRVLKAMDLYNKTDKASAIKRLELMCDETDEYRFDLINKGYIRGLFCAEGCLRVYTVTISQKGCLDLLRAIQVYIGTQLGRGPDFGKVGDTEWRVSRIGDVKLFLDWMTNENTHRLFHEEKAAQVDAFYAYYNTRDQEHAAELTRLKHVDKDISKAELQKVNASALFFTATLRSAVAGRTIEPNAPRAPPLDDDQRDTVRTLLETTDMSLKAIADEVKCTKEQVQYLKTSQGIHRPNPAVIRPQLTPEQERCVKAMLFSKDKDFSYQAIAKIVKCTKGQVSTYATLVKAPPRKPGRKPKETGVEAVTEKPLKPGTDEKRKMTPRLNRDQQAKLQRLLENNAKNTGKTLTHADIAKEVKCSSAQVTTYKKKWLAEAEVEKCAAS